MKKVKNFDSELLNLLKAVLPKAAPDPKLADQIYEAVANELRAKARVNAFNDFCATMAVPNLEPDSLDELREQLEASFGKGEIQIETNEDDQTVGIQVALDDGSTYSSSVRVDPEAASEQSEEQEIKPKFIPCPVALPGDPELIWILAKHETITPEEAAIALEKVEEEFWATKTGQKLQRDRVEKCFPEFIARVPASMLKELGLKRHYKTPEPVKVLRRKPR